MDSMRQERLISCMNAAVNLYGVVSFAELIRLYNRYAADELAPVSHLLTESEIDAILALPPDDFDLEAQERWFKAVELDGVRYLVSEYGFAIHIGEADEEIHEESVREQLAAFVTPDLKVLPWDDFSLYEEPKAFEETGVTKRVAKFLRQEYGYEKTEAEFAVWDLQEAIRYSASLYEALETARVELGIEVCDRDEFEDLVDVLTPLVRNTRAWNYRGHTESELVSAGVLKGFLSEDVEDAFDQFMKDGEADWPGDGSTVPDDGEDEDWEPDAWDTGVLSDKDLAEILPPAEYPKGPVDFRFVKDHDKREQALADYQNVRNVTGDFVREVLVKALSGEARKAAYRRLGFPVAESVEDWNLNLDIVAGDFAIMLDDQFGETVLQKVLKDWDKLSDYHRLGAQYFKNVHYAWLVVEAVKSGVGVKCRNLMNGEELFLMEKSFSLNPNVKGMTVCANIAPMGDVYLSLGVLHPADFEPSPAVHRLVRQNLGLPLDGPLDLSSADEARFAEDTIRRIYALGRFDFPFSSILRD